MPKICEEIENALKSRRPEIMGQAVPHGKFMGEGEIGSLLMANGLHIKNTEERQ